MPQIPGHRALGSSEKLNDEMKIGLVRASIGDIMETSRHTRIIELLRVRLIARTGA